MVRVGQVWRDRDPRSPNDVTVVGMEGLGVFARVQIQRPSRRVWVSLYRFVRAFSFVSAPPQPEPDA